MVKVGLILKLHGAYIRREQNVVPFLFGRTTTLDSCCVIAKIRSHFFIASHEIGEISAIGVVGSVVQSISIEELPQPLGLQLVLVASDKIMKLLSLFFVLSLKVLHLLNRDDDTHACVKAKIADFRFHDLRHTAATRLADRGADAFQIAAILGHSSIQMTARYTHATSDGLRRVMESLAVNNKQVGIIPPTISPQFAVREEESNTQTVGQIRLAG